jgi:hypothetical protein
MADAANRGSALESAPRNQIDIGCSRLRLKCCPVALLLPTVDVAAVNVIVYPTAGAVPVSKQRRQAMKSVFCYCVLCRKIANPGMASLPVRKVILEP